jgi:hypothetical protein
MDTRLRRRWKGKNSTSVSLPSTNSQNSKEPRKRKRIEEDKESSGTSKAADVPPQETFATVAAPAVATLWDLALLGS